MLLIGQRGVDKPLPVRAFRQSDRCRAQVVFRAPQEADSMEPRATGNSSASNSKLSGVHPREGRSVWIVTLYAISGLSLFGILAYFFSSYVTR
jgi:hypothetical protein